MNWLRKWESGPNLPNFSLRRITMRLKIGNSELTLPLPRFNPPKPDRLLALLQQIFVNRMKMASGIYQRPGSECRYTVDFCVDSVIGFYLLQKQLEITVTG